MKSVKEVLIDDDVVQEEYAVIYHSLESSKIYIKQQQEPSNPTTMITYLDGSVRPCDIVGEIYGDYNYGSPTPTTQIDNITNAVSIVVGNSVTSVGNYAFFQCPSLTNVIIPNSVTSIGEYAFNACSSLVNVTIPNSVTSIGGGAFHECASLTNVIIPNSVTSIGASAFRHCTNLLSVTIPNSVTKLQDRVLSECANLKSVTIPNSVTSIGTIAFQNCQQLTSITFEGTIVEWQAISKGSDWHNHVPSSCIVHCTDGDTTLD